MRRREVIVGVGAAAWPVVVRAQQAVMPVVGFLFSSTSKEVGRYIAGLTAGWAEIGYVEGRNVAFEYRMGRGSLRASAGSGERPCAVAWR
jgi:putative tryptophan/tyrosine transport system substrate-binding protein